MEEKAMYSNELDVRVRARLFKTALSEKLGGIPKYLLRFGHFCICLDISFVFAYNKNPHPSCIRS